MTFLLFYIIYQFPGTRSSFILSLWTTCCQLDQAISSLYLLWRPPYIQYQGLRYQAGLQGELTIAFTEQVAHTFVAKHKGRVRRHDGPALTLLDNPSSGARWQEVEKKATGEKDGE